VRPVLVRIDDRLVHGQVLVAWATALRPERIVLANDEAAADPDRRRMYAAMSSEECAVSVLTLGETAAELQRAGGQRALVVLGSPADARRLLQLGAPLQRLNVGGLHQGEAKRRLLDYVFLSRQDVADLQALLADNVALEARDLPDSRAVRLDAATLGGLGA